MATDYVVFIHGVSTREQVEPPTYADALFALIQESVARHSKGKSVPHLVKVPLYWGSVGVTAENELLKEYQHSSKNWKKFWFKKMRSTVLLEFAGDVALYMSRYVGAKVADKLKEDAVKQLAPAMLNPDCEDRLHLIAHSLGTVVLFDILFSARWDQEGIPGYESVKTLREGIYGVEPNWQQGIRLASISTMGSPLSLFSLMNVDKSSVEKRNGKEEIVNTHDVTPRLQQFLERLPTKLNREGKRLPWLNFAHPGDPLASPLVPLLPHMVDHEQKYVQVEDIILKNTTFADHVGQVFSNSSLSLLHAGGAHLSYLKSHQVAERVAEVILESTKHRKAQSTKAEAYDMVK
ncbi:MAG: hypothetical protein NVSMB49_02060 [Ktedonobacteraceae bacterium]